MLHSTHALVLAALATTGTTPEPAKDAPRALVARKILTALGEPIHFRNHSTRVRTTIGIACFPRDAVEPEELWKRADTALHHAKERGGNRFDFYTDGMNAALQRRVAIEERLRLALAQESFEVHYQPQFDLTRGRTSIS